MGKLLIYATMAFFLCSSHAVAEMYQYVDKNGVLSFTDDVSKLSAKQREKLIQLPEYKSLLKSARRITGAIPQDGEANGPALEPDTNIVLTPALQEEGRRLDEHKRSLDLDYNQILEERQRLLELGGRLKRNGEIAPEILENYKSKVEALNKKIVNYEAQLKAYEDRIKDFNSRAIR